MSFAEREQARPKVKGAQVYGIDISEESVAKAKKVNFSVKVGLCFHKNEWRLDMPDYDVELGQQLGNDAMSRRINVWDDEEEE